ncbi:hypothetical protein GCM10025778_14790 [Paeniglutamicibacter antarcticus]|uniref:Uncharacterized protein n=1 Tax=Paeniglutamicibacter antarcticus TaxID=494023 RepID=A0ABP9TKK1_9MICC
MSLDTGGQIDGIPAVADDHYVQLDVALLQQAAKRPVKFGGPIAHGEYNDPDGRQNAC